MCFQAPLEPPGQTHSPPLWTTCPTELGLSLPKLPLHSPHTDRLTCVHTHIHSTHPQHPHNTCKTHHTHTQSSFACRGCNMIPYPVSPLCLVLTLEPGLTRLPWRSHQQKFFKPRELIPHAAVTWSCYNRACGKLGFKSCLNGGDINPEWVEPSEKRPPLAQNLLTSCLSLDPKSYHWGVTAVFELFLMMQSITYHILSDCANHSPPYMYHPGRKMCRIIRFS